jgi:hypothetical protein
MTSWEKRYKLLTTVDTVLRGHLWEKEKGSFKTGDPPLKEAQFILHSFKRSPVLKDHIFFVPKVVS